MIDLLLNNFFTKNVDYKILGNKDSVALADISALEGKFDHEYLIKYKNMSHMHVQWLSASEIGKFKSVNLENRNILNFDYLESWHLLYCQWQKVICLEDD